MNSSFEPAAIEASWYRVWEEHGWFAAGAESGRQAFCIQLPPPNVTGTLHMGHAFNQTIMDALTRYHRMRGFNTLWLPGTDHAGIATQIVVERQIEAAGGTREQLGRERFVEQVWKWKEQSGSTITAQMRRLGASADWSREYFTMDARLSAVVAETFVRLYEQGLIYRGKRLVNWIPRCARPSPTSRWRARRRTASCGASATRASTVRASSSSPPRARRRCWATPRWR